MKGMEELESEIEKIKRRNMLVESDKAWETSFSRRGLLALFTFLAIGFYLQAIGIQQPWQNAFVPAMAFMLSTLTLPFFKVLWKRHVYHKKG